MTKILYIPDNQVKPGVDTDYLSAIGQYIVETRPDYIICAGDFADMPSCSSYAKGVAFEGKRYKADVASVHAGMEKLLKPLRDFNLQRLKWKEKLYRPKMILTLGNHENRINRVINDNPILEGTISVDDLNYEHYGWEVIPFLETTVIEGVCFSHYFTTGLKGLACSTAAAQLTKKHMSCIAGHQQGRQSASAVRADGKRITSIIAGSCYDHDEDYLGAQGNKHWHGVVMLHNVVDGDFDEMFVPLHYLKSRYL